jgi:hypothetical protein
MAGKMDGIITQMNIRNNVREMQESVQELYAWEDEIKRKEAEMRKSRPSDVPREPEVRGKAPIVQPGGDSTMYQPSPRLLHGTLSSSHSTTYSALLLTSLAFLTDHMRCSCA